MTISSGNIPTIPKWSPSIVSRAGTRQSSGKAFRSGTLSGMPESDPGANTVVFTAHDGYTTSFPLDYIMNRDIIMAYRMNNVTLPAERGYPFELVAEDKWGYKWIKWIEKIELTDNPDYRGYWEQRGYRIPVT